MLSRSAHFRVFLLGSLACTLMAGPSAGQESSSGRLAEQLAALLDSAELEAFAARDPASEDQFVAALYIGGSQLLAVSARYAAPQRLESLLAEGRYRDVYVDLFSASIPETKIFISDLGADGLRSRRSGNNPYDTVELGRRRVAFNGNWRDQDLTEQDYVQAFREADEAYVRILTVLTDAARTAP